MLANRSGCVMLPNPESRQPEIHGRRSNAYARPASLTVDGTRDLVDFFPIWLDIKGVLDALPPNEYEYRLACEAS
jgi:hypothetical protein